MQLPDVLRGLLSSKPSKVATTQHSEKRSSRGKSQTINTSRVALLQSLRSDTGRADCYRNAHGSFANYREPAAHTEDSTNGALRTRPLF